VRVKKSRPFAGAGLPLTIGMIGVIDMVARPVASAAALFADDLEDGSAEGWTTSGGGWSVVAEGSRVYQRTGTGVDARALVGGARADQAVRVRVRSHGHDGTARHMDVLGRRWAATEPPPAGMCDPSGRPTRNNVFTGAGPGRPGCGGSVEEPRNYHGYPLEDPHTVRTSVMGGAGAGRI
jgi:hypothetical protein